MKNLPCSRGISPVFKTDRKTSSELLTCLESAQDCTNHHLVNLLPRLERNKNSNNKCKMDWVDANNGNNYALILGISEDVENSD